MVIILTTNWSFHRLNISAFTIPRNLFYCISMWFFEIFLFCFLQNYLILHCKIYLKVGSNRTFFSSHFQLLNITMVLLIQDYFQPSSNRKIIIQITMVKIPIKIQYYKGPKLNMIGDKILPFGTNLEAWNHKFLRINPNWAERNLGPICMLLLGLGHPHYGLAVNMVTLDYF